MKLILIFFALFSFATEDEVMLSPDCAGVVAKNLGSFTKTCKKANGVEVDYTFTQSSMRPNDRYDKWIEISKEDGVVEGPYIEWGIDESYKRVEGSFSKGKPKGVWTVKEKETKDSYQVIYDDTSSLSKVVISKGKEKPVTFKIGKMEAKEIQQKRMLGAAMPMKVDPLFPDRFVYDRADWRLPEDIPLEHVLFYSSPDKKEVVGVAITNYRFLPRNICQSSECDGLDDRIRHTWYVFDKKNNMCMTAFPAKNLWNKRDESSPVYELWFECGEFIDVYAFYAEKELRINKGNTVYLSPGGKKAKIKDLKKDRWGGSLAVILTGKKMVGKELWIEIKITGDEGIDLGNYWIPFYVGNQISLEIFRGID